MSFPRFNKIIERQKRSLMQDALFALTMSAAMAASLAALHEAWK